MYFFKQNLEIFILAYILLPINQYFLLNISAVCENRTNNFYTDIVFVPSDINECKFYLFNDSYDLRNDFKSNQKIVFKSINIYYFYFYNPKLFIRLGNLLGLDLTTKFINDYYNKRSYLFGIKLDSLNYDFYINNLLVTYKCDDFGLFKTSIKFKNMDFVSFGSFTRYGKNICPYIFCNAEITELHYSYFTKSFILINYPTYLIKNISHDFNSKIINLDLGSNFHVRIDQSIVNKHIFKHLLIIKLSGVVNEIENFFFSGFKFLQRIQLNFDNMRQFLYSHSDWKFLKNLKDFPKYSSFGNLLKKHIQSVRYVAIESITKYNFPEYDLCLFKNFPHYQLVFPILMNRTENLILGCNCTIIWLLYFSREYMKYIDVSNNSFDLDHFFLTKEVQHLYYSSV